MTICLHAHEVLPYGEGAREAFVRQRPYTGSISASSTACLLRGYGRAGTQNDRLAEAVNLSTSGNAEMGPI